MKILVVTGASGGHIFPALSFIGTLKEKYPDSDILLVLQKRSIKTNIVPDVCCVKFISITNIQFSFNLKNFRALLNFIKGSLESLSLLIKFKPDIVMGFGSLNSVPLLLFAWLMRIKTLIHEQNVVPGRANRLLSKLVDRVAISFAQTKDYLSISGHRVVVTGNPIRSDLKKIERPEALNFFGFEEDKFTILIMGGSQGSSRINYCFIDAISGIAEKIKLQVIHLAGAKDLELLSKSYKGLGVSFRLFTFLDNIHFAYSIADLAITRAGAGTITELIKFGIPSIIIPYPFAYEHQMANAGILESSDCCMVIEDNRLNAEVLKKAIESLIDNPKKLDNMRSGYKRFLTGNASESLVNAAVSLVSS